MSEQPQAIYLKDYQVPAYLVERTELRFELAEEQTTVIATLQMIRNPDCNQQAPALQLHGHDSMVLQSLQLDGEPLMNYQHSDELLTIAEVPERFSLQIVTLIEPQNNTALEGLYKSDGMFCTQCEAEGFRRITFYPDRPDVMAVFRTTIVADKAKYPVLLSNGNPVERGELDDGRHFVTWDDPFKKPAYLFALVAGDLQHIEERYTTASGREVILQIFAEAKDLNKLQYAMDSLKNAMRWDEQVYGREYDLDIYMIVAVDFFNMGAMENKGLNIFNTSCVLANPETTTDAAFQRVEGVVAHEYFHNWSGNRVTCRDWFQLSLKEGFTVFRDAEFSADMNSRTVKRVEDVTLLRTAQFAEDAGPMAHPVRPESFIEISNFYTLTVYEKGAEVVRMIHTLLGPELFRKGSDLYFERHDGQAVTTDDFVQAMEDASGRDLSQFRRWYSQAGTPRLAVSDSYDEASGRYQLHVKQSCPATPEAERKLPFHIPLAIGLLDGEGNDLPLTDGQTSQVLDLTEAEQTFTFEDIPVRPVPSLLRGFSAPVKLSYPYSREQLVFLIRHDSDGFNRWDAAQTLATELMEALVADYQAGRELQIDSCLVDAFAAVLDDSSLDPAMVAKTLSLPSEAYLAERAEQADVEAIHAVREFLRLVLAKALRERFERVYRANCSDAPYSPDAESIARRSLKNLCLAYLMTLQQQNYLQLALDQYHQADNMSDAQSALVQVVHSGFDEAREQLLGDFYQRWQKETLVVNQWLSVQASNPQPDTLGRVRQLMEHPAFDIRNPNRVRALLAVFCAQNPVNFHAGDGSGYRFLAEQVIRLNELNPQIASRLLTPMTRWRKFDPQRQTLMKGALQQVMDSGELSRDVYEVVSKSLA
ncbi:aminopeptidase N [Marinobacterium arenosum]|uniref:aminopeptidase N n=1 Tax=Marinobacterium arenosum TaxID=2862496 RepID=UPI001C96D68F|nr:aminopeptidase N [Marinobacterium arenosum]MBY4677986.1 aminopeptidase N [Marinobacterium arenosum]